MNDQRRLRDIFIGSQKLRAKILSHSRYKTLPALNSRYNEKRQWPVPMVRGKNIHAVSCEDNNFQKGKCKLLNSFFHSVYLAFSMRLFSIADLFACVSCGTYCNAHKCCVVTHRAADIRVALLDLNSCLRSHVLRAHCNFESKQANLITLFGRRPNNNRTNCLGEK